MNGLLFAVAVVAGTYTVLAPETPRDELDVPCVTFESTFQSTTVSFLVCGPELRESPSWPHPETSEPPLSRSKAIALSKNQLARYFPDPKRWELIGVELYRSFVADRWYYVVSWRPANWRLTSLGDKVEVGVLMDGRPLELTFKRKSGTKDDAKK